jgi:hypothetical protein
MPGVAHPPHHGFATKINNLATGLAAVSQQQSYPGVILSAGSQTITNTGSLAPLPAPLSAVINASASLRFLVGLSALMSSLSDSESVTGLMSFTVNGSEPTAVDFPLQLITNSLEIAVSVSATYLVDGNAVSSGGLGDNVRAGGNTFEITASTNIASATSISSFFLFALPI